MNLTTEIEKKIKQAEAKLAEAREMKRKESDHKQVLALHGCYVVPINDAKKTVPSLLNFLKTFTSLNAEIDNKTLIAFQGSDLPLILMPLESLPEAEKIALAAKILSVLANELVRKSYVIREPTNYVGSQKPSADHPLWAKVGPYLASKAILHEQVKTLAATAGWELMEVDLPVPELRKVPEAEGNSDRYVTLPFRPNAEDLTVFPKELTSISLKIRVLSTNQCPTCLNVGHTSKFCDEPLKETLATLKAELEAAPKEVPEQADAMAIDPIVVNDWTKELPEKAEPSTAMVNETLLKAKTMKRAWSTVVAAPKPVQKKKKAARKIKK
jgi:hypothetical protein